MSYMWVNLDLLDSYKLHTHSDMIFCVKTHDVLLAVTSVVSLTNSLCIHSHTCIHMNMHNNSFGSDT
jgi:hypothetical protein